MNYADIKTHVNEELVQDFTDPLFARWQDIVRKWLRRDYVANNLLTTGSVTATGATVTLPVASEYVRELYIKQGSQQMSLHNAPLETIRNYAHISGNPLYYTIRGTSEIEVAPDPSGHTIYYVTVGQDTAMVSAGDTSQALDDAPGMVLAAFKWCAYGHQHDREAQAIEKQNYIDELLAYREHEAMRINSEAPVSSGAWTWDA